MKGNRKKPSSYEVHTKRITNSKTIVTYKRKRRGCSPWLVVIVVVLLILVLSVV